MIKFLSALVAILGAIVALVLPSLRKENEKLNSEVKQKDNEIKNRKENAEIIKKTTNLDFVSNSSKLRKRKGGASK